MGNFEVIFAEAAAAATQRHPELIIALNKNEVTDLLREDGAELLHNLFQLQLRGIGFRMGAPFLNMGHGLTIPLYFAGEIKHAFPSAVIINSQRVHFDLKMFPRQKNWVELVTREVCEKAIEGYRVSVSTQNDQKTGHQAPALAQS